MLVSRQLLGLVGVVLWMQTFATSLCWLRRNQALLLQKQFLLFVCAQLLGFTVLLLLIQILVLQSELVGNL